MPLLADRTGTAPDTRTGVVPVHSFRSVEMVDMAAESVAGMLGEFYLTPTSRALLHRPANVRLVERYTFDLAPGVVALKRHAPKPYEADDVAWSSIGERELYLHEDLAALDAWEPPADAQGAEIREWSRSSRARFHRRMAELDLTPFEGQRVGMVTLTLPNDWLAVAPTGGDFKRLIQTFRKSWERATGVPMRAVWKLEFQERGAPHLHLLVPVPVRFGKIAAAYWIGAEWVRICDPAEPDRARMLRAHLPSAKRRHGVIDFSRKCTDPKRVAVYFGKHSAKTRDSKEYQHIVPEAWRVAGAGPGRFWGYWGLTRAVRSVEVTRSDFFRLRRVLRHVDRARAAAQALLQRAASWINGEALRRATLEGLRVRRSGRLRGDGGGWVLSNDALVTAWDMARAIAPPDLP